MSHAQQRARMNRIINDIGGTSDRPQNLELMSLRALVRLCMRWTSLLWTPLAFALRLCRPSKSRIGDCKS
jgi:hypothetical protein